MINRDYYQKVIVLLAMLLVPSIVYASMDVNIEAIDTNPDASVLPTFSYYSDGNLTIDFNVQSTDSNTIFIDLNYSSSNTQGTGTVILEDYNAGTATVCATADLNSQTACSWDWNISSSLVADGNYYILIFVDNNTATDFNASDNIFMVDNTAPSTAWDGNTTWQSGDANVNFTCSDGTAGAQAQE